MQTDLCRPVSMCTGNMGRALHMLTGRATRVRFEWGVNKSYERGTPVHEWRCWGSRSQHLYRGASLIRKRPPPYEPPMTLGTGLR